jgi:hypothetical protein
MLVTFKKVRRVDSNVEQDVKINGDSDIAKVLRVVVQLLGDLQEDQSKVYSTKMLYF